jgi:hypothetical protein
MTSDRARNAFALGRKALVRPDVLVSEPRRGMPLRAPERPRPASLPMRLFALLALFMGVYVALLGLDVLGEEFLPHDALARAETVFAWAVAASIFSLLVLIRMFLVRRQRRGFGLALLAFLALWGSTSFLSTAIQVARDPTVPGPGAVHRPWSWSQVRRNHPFPWGRSPGRADPWGIFRQGSR